MEIQKFIRFLGTMTGEALKFVVTRILQPSHGSRIDQGVQTILIILTDGKSQDYSRGTLTQYQRIAKVSAELRAQGSKLVVLLVFLVPLKYRTQEYMLNHFK